MPVRGCRGMNGIRAVLHSGGMSRLKAQVRDARSLSVSLMTDMYSLYEEYYEATSEKRFFQDLADRDHAIILTDSKDVLRGFSTLAVHSFLYEHAPLRAIFSGDTILIRVLTKQRDIEPHCEQRRLRSCAASAQAAAGGVAARP